MKDIFFKTISLTGFTKLTRYFYQRKNITVLVFHKPSFSSFKQSVEYLMKKKYHIISLKDYIEAIRNKTVGKLPAYSIVITFDDGHMGNYSLLPLIKKYKIPVTIFLTAGIINTKRHFWFTKKHEVSNDKDLKKISNSERKEKLQTIGFEETKEYNNPQALSEKQIKDMSPYVDFQSHTMAHPILPMCTDEESKYEIFESKKQLESKYGFKINSIAYPNGDYSEREINFCKEAGYLAAFTTESGFNNKHSHPFQLKRIGTNDTEDIDELVLRVTGVWYIFKRFTSLFRKKILKA